MTFRHCSGLQPLLGWGQSRRANKAVQPANRNEGAIAAFTTKQTEQTELEVAVAELIVKAYDRLLAFLDALWEEDRDSDLGALLGAMQRSSDGQLLDPGLYEDWKDCLRNPPATLCEEYEAANRFIERAARTWITDSDYLTRLPERMRSTERERLYLILERLMSREE